MGNESYLLASWCLAIKNTLELDGHDSSRVFLENGVSDQIFSLPGKLVLTEQMTNIWSDCVRLTNKTHFGLMVGQNAFPAMLSGLGVACMLSGTVRDAYTYVVNHCDIVSSACDCNIKKYNRSSEFIISNSLISSGICEESYDAFLAHLVCFPEKYMGVKMDIIEVHLERSKPENINPYIDIFGENIFFSAKKNSVIFKDRCLDIPALNSETQIFSLIHNSFSPPRKSAVRRPVEQKVRDAIIENLEEGRINLPSIADEMMMSASSLQKKLSEENTSYKEILESIRKKFAFHYLETTDLPIKTVASKLGFRSASNFSRAFKLWNQLSPQAYRDEQNESRRE